jgi:outer membrane protein TolC
MEKRQAQLRRTQLDVRSELARELIDYHSSLKSIDRYMTASRSAREVYELDLERYRMGLITITELQTSRDRSQEAADTYQKKLIDLTRLWHSLRLRGARASSS